MPSANGFYYPPDTNSAATLSQEQEFVEILSATMHACHALAKSKGEWPGDVTPFKPGKVSSLRSIIEGWQASLSMHMETNDDPRCPEFTAEEIVAAELFIQLMDYCCGFKVRLPLAIIAKLDHNAGRRSKPNAD